jgi:hypothetical protein
MLRKCGIGQPTLLGNWDRVDGWKALGQHMKNDYEYWHGFNTFKKTMYELKEVGTTPLRKLKALNEFMELGQW